MSALLVTYDLKKPGQDYEDFHRAIISFSWARLSESSYAIDTTLSPSQTCHMLRPHMDAKDTLYIISLRKPYSGHGPSHVNDWLEQHLP